MDHKTWLWRRRTSEKTTSVAQKVEHCPKGCEQEKMEAIRTVELEKSIKYLNEKLSSALMDCAAKDDLVSKQAKLAEEAISGWKKAEAEASSFKIELENALFQKTQLEDKANNLGSALADCKEQLRFVREDQEKRVQDITSKATKDFNETRMILEDKLIEMKNELTMLSEDNQELTKIVQSKEGEMEILKKEKSRVESSFNELMSRFTSLEKSTASFKYEICMLEKELEIRDEEREFNCKSADATHKQHLESVKKITKLETECQRLRVLVRKRLPGPAAVAKMKREVEILERDSFEMNVKNSNSRVNGSKGNNNVLENFTDTTSKRIELLVQKLSVIEQENKNLREKLAKKNTFQSSNSKTVFAQPVELSHGSYEPTLISISEDGRNEDELSRTESWASALINELENFKNEKSNGSSCKSSGISDMSGLMDDFIEMERSAMVTQTKSPVCSQLSAREINPCEILLKKRSEIDKEFHSNSDDAISTNNRLNYLEIEILSQTISKIIKLIEGLNQSYITTDGDSNVHSDSSTLADSLLHNFEEKRSELCNVLQDFVEICRDVLDGKAQVENIVTGMTTVLECILNRFISLKDLPAMKNAIKTYLDWDKQQTEKMNPNHAENLTLNGEMSKIDLNDENRNLKTDLKESLLSVTKENETLARKLKETEQNILNLQNELVKVKESKGKIRDQVENHKVVNEELGAQLTAARNELNEARHKFSSLEAEFEDKSYCCEELEATCLELQLQLEGVTMKETSENCIEQEENQKRANLEIIMASKKLEECQETILHLGQQIKALAAPKDADPVDKATSSLSSPPPIASMNGQRSSLLHQMLAEDDMKSKSSKSPQTKEIICIDDTKKSSKFQHNKSKAGLLYGNIAIYESHNSPTTLGDSIFSSNSVKHPKTLTLAIVSKKKRQGGSSGLFKKLLLRRGSGKKTNPSIIAYEKKT